MKEGDAKVTFGAGVIAREPIRKAREKDHLKTGIQRRRPAGSPLSRGSCVCNPAHLDFPGCGYSGGPCKRKQGTKGHCTTCRQGSWASRESLTWAHIQVCSFWGHLHSPVPAVSPEELLECAAGCSPGMANPHHAAYALASSATQ